MEFELDKLLEYIMELIAFVKPVSSLISDWFQSLFINIREFGMVFFIAVTLAILGFFYVIFNRLSNS